MEGAVSSRMRWRTTGRATRERLWALAFAFATSFALPALAAFERLGRNFSERRRGSRRSSRGCFGGRSGLFFFGWPRTIAFLPVTEPPGVLGPIKIPGGVGVPCPRIILAIPGGVVPRPVVVVPSVIPRRVERSVDVTVVTVNTCVLRRCLGLC